MDIDLKNRKVVITGVSEGIGRSLALAFGEAGAKVAGSARNYERLRVIESEISGTGHFFFSGDFSKSDDIQTFYDETISAMGGVDVLINNVGSIQKLAGFFDLSDEDWQEVFDLNLMSAVRTCRLFSSSLKQSVSPSIINITSVAASRPGDVFPHYSAVKAGLCNLTISLARSLASEKVLVNSVSPGPVWSKSWDDEAKNIAEKSGNDLQGIVDEMRTSSAETLLLKRMGVPDDVTGLVLFLASDLSGWITASNFTVDGGFNQNPY
jgi:NAD(P)-dependent dehydrogenase (short-subunit alcohol dehydrogenase family)